MLFINFLCLFFLMVLINCHTISKSIINNKETNGVFENINNLDDDDDDDGNNGRYHRKWRREDFTYDSSKQFYLSPKSTLAKRMYKGTTNRKNVHLNNLMRTALLTTKKKRKGIWRRLHKKFKFGRNDKDEEGDAVKRRQVLTDVQGSRPSLHLSELDNYMTTTYAQNINFTAKRNEKKNDINIKYGVRYPNKDRETRFRNPNRNLRLANEAEDRFDQIERTPRRGHGNRRYKKSIEVKIIPYRKMSTHRYRLPTLIKTYKPLSKTSDDFMDLLADISPERQKNMEFDNEKLKMNGITPLVASGQSKTNYLPSNTEAVTINPETLDNSEFSGTAQIEALLNDIKVKAIQMIAEQNPSISDIITNAVTETTFAADPIISHINMDKSNHFSTFVSIKDINKRSAEDNDDVEEESNVDKSGDKPKMDDILTTVRSNEIVGDEPSWKRVFEKVKEFVVEDVKEDLKEGKKKIQNFKIATVGYAQKIIKPCLEPSSTIKKKCTTTKKPKPCCDKDCCKVKCCEKCCDVCVKGSEPTHAENRAVVKEAAKQALSPGSFAFRKNRSENETTVTTTPRMARSISDETNYLDKRLQKLKESNTKSTATTLMAALFDDYEMLSLYEKMLKKSREDNVMKMLSAQIAPTNKKIKRENCRLSKRNSETLTDLNLKKDVEKLYEEGEGMPEELDYNEYDMTTTEPTNTNSDYQNEELDSSTNIDGLSKKIYFKDYVNGYKHYLDFQREQEVMPDAVNDNTIAAANGLNELEELRDEIQDFELNDRTVSPYDSADQDLDPEEELSHNLMKKYANHKYIQDPKEVTILPRNNNRRNARRVPEFDDELKYTASDKELGKKSKNQGYVDVNIVAQPTSIVNLRDANTKSSRIKSFFSKFSLRKKNKTRKIKRDSNRYQRFNPLKGIKEMFYAKNTFTAATTETTDFEMPAHVQGFKPIKYSKTPTIDEMKAEISVMSGDDKNAPVYLESKKVTPSTKLVDVLLPWEYGTNQDSYYIKPNQYTQPTRPIYGSAGSRGVKKCVTNSNLTKIENEPIKSLLERVRIKKSKGAKNSKQSTSSSKMTKPEQYFATPVPMENSDFEKFLVEHDIDVGSVTSPLFKLPSVNRDPTTTVASNSEEMLDLLNNIEHTPQPTETTNSDVAVVLKSLSKKQYLINPNIANHLRRSLINFKHQKSKDKISRHYTPEPSKVVDDEFDLTIINLSDMGSDTFNSKDAIMLPAGTFPDELMNPEDENTLFPTSFETSNTTISANNDPYMKETTVTDETIYSSTTMDEDNFPLSTSDDDSILNTDTLAEIKTKLNAAANAKHIADNLTSAKNFPILTWPMTDENVYSGTAAPSLTSNPSTTKSSIKNELTTETLPKDTPTTKPATVSENNESWAPTASLDIEDSTKIAGFDAKKHKSVTVVHEDLKDVPIISYPAEAITTTISANSGMRSPAETTDTTTLAPETTTSSEMIPNTVLTSTKLSKLSKVFEESKERVKAIFTNHHKFKSPFTSPISDAATYRYTNIQKKFHPANIPQVVRFSSHSCIYDLLFDSDKATKSPITKSTTPVTLTKMVSRSMTGSTETSDAGKEEKGGGLTDDKAKTSTKPARATEEKKKEEVVRKEREAVKKHSRNKSHRRKNNHHEEETSYPGGPGFTVTKHHRRHTPRPNLHKMALASLDFVPVKGNTKRRSAVTETTTTIISVTKRPRTRIEQGPRMLAHLPKTTNAQTKPTTTTTETMKAISEVVGPGAPAKAAGHLETDNLDSIDADAAAMEKTTDALTKQLKKTTDKLAMAGRVADVLQPASDTVLAARDRDALGRKLYGPPDNITASRAEAIKMTTVKVLGDLKRILTGHRQVVVSATHKNVTAKPATSTHKREASIYYDDYEEDLENIDPILLKKYAYPTTESNERVKKREIRESNMYTAKDVAALEVIVDLTENAINNEEKETTNNNMDRLFRADDVNTNVIKVHIGVPYNGDAALKRSLVPVKVRKVFSAKLSPPVDIAYQIHTYEETTTAAPRSNISPGKYMFISNESISLPRGNFFLKPISTRLENRFDPNPTASTKNVRSDSAATGRVTLSKDFIAAINCHLMQLYENLTTVPESTVSLKGMEENMTNFTTAKMVRRRRQCIDWSKIKKHFDINGTCCKKKYKPNVPIGKPCAASDAVIEEITFELENLSKFINCHCQELQTYFRMNPNGGRRLRNSVHKIDKLLNNFYKKAKEIKDCETKLKKKLCPIQTKPSPSSVGKQLLRDMDLLAYDMENAENYNISYNDAFGAVGREFIDSTRNCLILDDQERSNPLIRVKKHKTMKTYSLDNINVNIICDPQRSVGTEMDFGSVTNPTLKENSIGTNSLYDGRNIGVTGNSNHFPINTEKKGLKRFFFRRNKSQKKVKSRPFAYLVPTVYEEIQLPKKKRHVYENAIESPLITDGGGAFWHDYLAKTNTDKSRVVRDMSPTKNSTYGNKTSRINGFQKFFSNNKYYNKDAERNLNKVLITVSPFNNDVEELQTSTDNAELETLTMNGVLNLYNGPDWKYMDVENIYLNNLDADLINPPIGTVLADLESITTTTKAKKQETPLKAVTKSFTMTTLPVILEPSPKSHGTSKTTSRHTTNHQSSVKATEKHGNESFLSEKYSTNATLHLQRTDTTSSAQGSVNPYPYMRPGLNSSNNPHSKKTTTTATLKAKPVKKIKTNASKHDKKKTGYKTMTTTIIGTLLYHNDNMLNRTAGDETLSGTLAPVKHMYNTVKKSVQDSLCKIKNKPTTTKKNKKTTKKSTWCKTTKTKAKSQRKKTSTAEKKTKKKKKKKKKKKEHKKKKKKKDKDKNPGCKMFAFNKENDLSKKYKWAGSTDASYLDYNAKSGDDSMDQDTVFEDDYKSDEEESPESEKADKSEKENKSHKEKGSDKDDIYLSDDDLRLEMKYNTVEAANKLGDKYNKIDEQEENSEDKLKSEDNTKMKDKQKCEGHSNEDKGDSEDDDEEYENPVRFSTNSHSPTANIKSDDKEDGDDNDHFTNRSPISRDSQDNDNYMYEDYSRKPSGNYLKSLMFGIKSGTLNIFNRISKDFADGKNIQQQCAVCPVTTPINSLVGKNSKAVEINGKANANLYAQLTTSNPTILIINDYDHLNSDSEERVSVDGKMSTIANFKEDKKNTKSMFDNSNAFEVYERFKQKEKLKSSNEKYLNEYDSLERTTSSLSKQSKQNVPSSHGNENYNVFEVFKSLDMPDDVSSTTKKRGLFKKLSQKFSFKHGKDKKFKRKLTTG